MNRPPNLPVGKWQDSRELIRRASRIYVEPIAYDLFARIIPGTLLVLGTLSVWLGLALTWDLIAIAWNGIVLLTGSFATWLLGLALLPLARRIGYAKPPQPTGWRKYEWFEALDDFENRAPLELRRKAGRARILSDGSIASGTALLGVLLAAVVTLATPAAWTVLALFALTAVCLAIHVRLGARWALGLTFAFGVALLICISQLDRPWQLPVALLIIAVASLRGIHVVSRKQAHAAAWRVVSRDSVMTSRKTVPTCLGQQAFGSDDQGSAKSTYRKVYDSVFANPYYKVWGIGGQRLPVYRVTLESVLRGILPFNTPFQFQKAAERTVDSQVDLRPGPDGQGYRRLLHPNGICLFGTWEITGDSEYTGYFRKGKRALLIARYSTCCTETRRNRRRSLSMVGKLYPTGDQEQEVHTANFITQQDLGGERNEYINDAEFRNAPDATVWRRGLGLDGLPVILLTGLLFKRVDRQAANRQLYEIAELGEDGDSKTPEFMRIVVDAQQPRIEGEDLDFRDEILGQIYDPGQPAPNPDKQLVFHIEVSDTGRTIGPAVFQRRKVENWRRIGRMVFTDAVASYNGDFVIHFHHPGWREDREDSGTAVRARAR